ncbi:MAG: hypothetical protein HQL31_13095 [Planctomycetes bacterium]|nr:hypothetical protein [Planctomycetota bacterium]
MQLRSAGTLPALPAQNLTNITGAAITMPLVGARTDTLTVTGTSSFAGTASFAGALSLGGNLGLQGALSYNVTSISSGNSYSPCTESVVIIDTTVGGNFTLSLPPVASNSGRILSVVRRDNLAQYWVLIDPNGAETIDGAANKQLNSQYHSVQIVSDGTAWFILGEKN